MIRMHFPTIALWSESKIQHEESFFFMLVEFYTHDVFKEFDFNLFRKKKMDGVKFIEEERKW